MMRHTILLPLAAGFFLVSATEAAAATLNIGHRGTGVNGVGNPFPENTLASFVQAVTEEKADGIELDVMLALPDPTSGDPFEALIIMHDESLNRTTTCDTPQPLDDCVALRTAADIRENCHPVNGDGVIFMDEPVPTLREVLVEIVSNRGKYVNIEIKNQPPTDPHSQAELCNSGEPANVSSLVTDLLLAEFDEEERSRIFISSFNPFAATAAKHESTVLGAPVESNLLVIGFRDLVSPQAPDATYAAILAKALGLDGIHPSGAEATAEAIAFAKSLGLRVRPWTINDPDVMQALIDLEVDAIITDEPCVLAPKVGVSGAVCPN